jgi:transposase
MHRTEATTGENSLPKRSPTTGGTPPRGHHRGLHDALAAVEGKRPTRRLVAAIASNNGLSRTEPSEWFGVGRRPIDAWLERLPLRETVADDNRYGRKQKLSEKILIQFRETFHEPPIEAGYDRPAWTTELVRHHLEETHHVEYSTPSCRRLLEEAGMVCQRPRRANADGEPEYGGAVDQTRNYRPGNWVRR